MGLFENKLIIAVFGVLAIFISLSNYLWGIWMPDNFYWIELSSRWQDSGMCLLSLWSMHEWHLLFGQTLFANRILAWVLNILVVFVLYFGILNKEKRKKGAYYLCGALVIMGPGISKCCTPDCFTSVLAAILLLLSLRLNAAKQQWNYIILLGILTGLCITARFPNILFIPVIMLYLLLSYDFHNLKWAKAISYTLLSLVSYWIFLYLFTNDVHCLNTIFNSVSESSSESNGRHSLIGLLLRYGKSVLLSLVAIIVMAGAWQLTVKLKLKNNIVKFLLSTAIISCVLSEIMDHIGMGYHSWSVCLVSLDAVLLSYYGYREWQKKNYRRLFFFAFLVMMAFVPSAGSDTGFQKSMMIACGLAPVVMVYSKEYIKKRICLKVFFVSSIIVSVFVFSEEFKYVNTRAENKFLNGIWLANWQIRNYDDLVKLTDPYFKKDKTIFYGFNHGHYLYCYYDTKVLYDVPFWMEKNDTISIGKAIDALNKRTDNVLIDLTKSDEHYFTDKGLKCVAQEASFNVYKYE